MYRRSGDFVSDNYQPTSSPPYSAPAHDDCDPKENPVRLLSERLFNNLTMSGH